MTRYDVTVLTPVFNGRKFLREAVSSVLAERVSGLQMIVIDDGSTDLSLDTVADLPIERVRLQKNRGMSGALNAGLEAARGEYVTFLDADDILTSGGLRWRLEWLAAHPGAPALGGRPAGIIDDRGNPLEEYPHVLHPGYKPPRELTLGFYVGGGAYPVAMWNFIFHRELVGKVGKFDETFKIALDCDYLFRVLRHVSIPIEFRPIVLRRLHDSNLSVGASDGRFSLKQETIDECLRIYAPFGVVPTQWHLWENGYT